MSKNFFGEVLGFLMLLTCPVWITVSLIFLCGNDLIKWAWGKAMDFVFWLGEDSWGFRQVDKVMDFLKEIGRSLI